MTLLMTAMENMAEQNLKIEVVKQRLLSEDFKRQERNGGVGEVKEAAFSGDKKKKSFKFLDTCHKYGKRGHLKKDCRQKAGGVANAAANQRKAASFVASRSYIKSKSGKIVFKIRNPVTISSTTAKRFRWPGS